MKAVVLLAAVLAQNPGVPKPAKDSYAVRMVESSIKRFPMAHAEWDYTAGVLLLAVEQVAKQTGEARYFDYIKRNMDAQVKPDGSISTYTIEEFNLDQINQGKLLFGLYERTRDARYQKAAHLLREQMRRHPRTREGGFWHKQVYPSQMWLDGVYMAAPFLAQYARTFNEPALFDDVAKQILLIARHTRDPASGLFYHAWDESKSMPWADSITGRSKFFWGRAIGWYTMAMVDVLDHLPATHADRAAILRTLDGLADAVAQVQDPVTGLWYQILDQPNRQGNYHEASASSMFAYAFAKGARKGYLPARYREIALRAYQGVTRHMVSQDAEGSLSLNRINQVAGLGGRQNRGTTFEYYVSEPVVSNDHKGVGPFILASLELGK